MSSSPVLPVSWSPIRAKHPRTTRNRVSGTEDLVLERRIWLETRFLDEIWARMLSPLRNYPPPVPSSPRPLVPP
ncbi:MAG TPA: hypothetical protein IGS52_17750 [Oscillatoriaceae cyanobacterium M33_DOE_052]|nr:hypothetical protein [Oscillatoriaceae cyanobacterium M33_DOE_052]